MQHEQERFNKVGSNYTLSVEKHIQLKQNEIHIENTKLYTKNILESYLWNNPLIDKAISLLIQEHLLNYNTDSALHHSPWLVGTS